MTLNNRNGNSVQDAVRAAIERHGTTRAELIPILNDINRAVGYVPAEAMEMVSASLRVPKSQLFSVATFYHMLSTKPRGQYVIQFCESAPCHVVGGREVWQALQENLDLADGETSADGKWSLVTVSCLGLCGVGPVIVINDDIFGNVTPQQVPEILSRYN